MFVLLLFYVCLFMCLLDCVLRSFLCVCVVAVSLFVGVCLQALLKWASHELKKIEDAILIGELKSEMRI